MTDRRSLLHLGATEQCPPRPELRAPQRAKVLLILDDVAEDRQTWIDCWAMVDGSWVLFLDDDDCRWASWPIQHIRCVEWQHPVIEEETA